MAKRMISNEEFNARIDRLIEVLDDFCKATGLVYDYENDDYKMPFVENGEKLTFDYRDMFASIEIAHADISSYRFYNR